MLDSALPDSGGALVCLEIRVKEADVQSVNVNRVLAVVIGGVAVLYIWMAYQIPAFPLPRPIDSDLFPKVLGFVLLGLSVLLFFEKNNVDEQAGVVSDEEASAVPLLVRPPMKVVVTSLAIVLYTFLLKPLGFVLASFLLCYGLAWYYGYRQHVVNFMTSAGVVVAPYLLMTRVMDVYLPRGILPF